LEFIAYKLTGNDIGDYDFEILDRTNQQGSSNTRTKSTRQTYEEQRHTSNC